MKKDKTGSKRKKVERAIIGGAKELFEKIGKKEEKIVIGKKEILSIVPYREDKIYLNRVVITDKTVAGEFLVTDESCAGHLIGDQPIFPGICIAEMAAQLLGVWAAQYFKEDKKLVYLKRLRAEVRGPEWLFFIDVKPSAQIIPGNLLVMEVPVKKENPKDGEEEYNLRIEISGRPGREIVKAMGENFSAIVGKDKKGVIFKIELPLISVST